MSSLKVPDIFRRLPPDIQICDNEVTSAELQIHKEISDKFLFERTTNPSGKGHQPDQSKIRAFRLMSGKSSWLEIGTFNKGNLAYISRILSKTARMIGIDVRENENKTRILLDFLMPGQVNDFKQIVGNSGHDETELQVAKIANGEGFDGIFIDGNHTCAFVMNDFARFGHFVKESGYIFFHDIMSIGNGTSYGVSQALGILDKHVPVWQIIGRQPVSRYLPPFDNKTRWGGIGVIRGEDLRRIRLC